MADDGFREIQLSGKQLAALFMGAAVVLVVTFLCGVLVGRGVRAQKEPAVAGDVAGQGASPAADPTAGVTATQPMTSGTTAQPPSTPPPTPPEEELSYYQRLESQGKPGEPAKAAAPAAPKDEKAQKAGAEVKDSKGKPLPPPPAPAVAATANAEPAGAGYALRVAAYKDRGQADSLATRLSGKGYGTFVIQLPATANGPGLYSVRVGKFKTRKEADAVKRRLEKEEQLKPSLIAR